MNIKTVLSKKRKIEIGIILLFCATVVACVTLVLLFRYRPSQNSMGALASVCLDVFSIVVLTILVISMSFEKEDMNYTTKLFLLLMLGTIYGLFFDFLTWSSDGVLAFQGKTYFYTCASLVGGSLLAMLFVLYLSNYMYGMYHMKSQILGAKICVYLNTFSFALTLVLAITKTAFNYVDGHYETGALYGLVTGIPVLTILYMTIWTVCHVKIIGIHDVIAVAGFTLTMVIGALVEEKYSIGTTYVGIALADIYIFVMLQNKLIAKIRHQRKLLNEKISSQFEILDSMADIYAYVNLVDLENLLARRFDLNDDIEDVLDLVNDPHTSLNKRIYENIKEEQKAAFWSFTDLATLSERMNREKIITAEFQHMEKGWFRAQYIRIGDSTDEPIKKVIYSIQIIDEEKKNVEKWIKKSNTDELTGFFNRNAYEDEMAAMEEEKPKSNFVYVSFDVNGLKMVNDSLGHEAGDEIILGACDCIKQCFGSYGKLYRTGGDEFAAFIYADDSQLTEIKKDLDEIIENWSGSINDHLTISCGYVTLKETNGMTLHDIAVLADKRMYEDKAKYYQREGIDRRGQRDAHVALYNLYTKILKVNISEDSYKVVNMNENEAEQENGVSMKFSEVLAEFARSGRVHPDDLEEYLSKTRFDYISEFFRNNDSSLYLLYRRKYGNEYKKALLEIIPAPDYSHDSQSLFLYVKQIDK